MTASVSYNIRRFSKQCLQTRTFKKMFHAVTWKAPEKEIYILTVSTGTSAHSSSLRTGRCLTLGVPCHPGYPLQVHRLFQLHWILEFLYESNHGIPLRLEETFGFLLNSFNQWRRESTGLFSFLDKLHSVGSGGDIRQC